MGSSLGRADESEVLIEEDLKTYLLTRYKKDIPELFKFNAFCIISDGVNNKAGSFFAPYEFYYA